eukprot:1328894-Amorphochlora_amoeboformis.AAC.2
MQHVPDNMPRISAIFPSIAHAASPPSFMAMRRREAKFRFRNSSVWICTFLWEENWAHILCGFSMGG